MKLREKEALLAKARAEETARLQAVRVNVNERDVRGMGGGGLPFYKLTPPWPWFTFHAHGVMVGRRQKSARLRWRVKRLRARRRQRRSSCAARGRRRRARRSRKSRNAKKGERPPPPCARGLRRVNGRREKKEAARLAKEEKERERAAKEAERRQKAEAEAAEKQRLEQEKKQKAETEREQRARLEAQRREERLKSEAEQRERQEKVREMKLTHARACLYRTCAS